MWISLVLGLGAHAAAPDVGGELRVERAVVERDGPRPKPWSLDAVLELRSTEDTRERPQNRSRQAVHELSVGARYDFGEGVRARVELSLEQINQQSTFFAKQAYVSYEPSGLAAAHLGQQFLPVGLIAPRDNWFSAFPTYYQKLFRFAKPVDLGAVADLYPLFGLRETYRDLAYLEGGAFSGRLVREQDQRIGSPERAPRVLSVKSRSALHDAFVTYFDHDLAFLDPVRTVGLGFEVRAPERWPVRGVVLGEAWQIAQVQTLGPTETTRAFTLYGEVAWWRLKAGYRWSESDARVASALGHERLALGRDHLAMFEGRLANALSLRVERVFARQDEILTDDWVYRALLNVTSL